MTTANTLIYTYNWNRTNSTQANLWLLLVLEGLGYLDIQS